MQTRDKACLLKYHEKRGGTLQVPPLLCIHHVNAAPLIYESLVMSVSGFTEPRSRDCEKGSIADCLVEFIDVQHKHGG